MQLKKDKKQKKKEKRKNRKKLIKDHNFQCHCCPALAGKGTLISTKREKQKQKNKQKNPTDHDRLALLQQLSTIQIKNEGYNQDEPKQVMHMRRLKPLFNMPALFILRPVGMARDPQHQVDKDSDKGHDCQCEDQEHAQPVVLPFQEELWKQSKHKMNLNFSCFMGFCIRLFCCWYTLLSQCQFSHEKFELLSMRKSSYDNPTNTVQCAPTGYQLVCQL